MVMFCHGGRTSSYVRRLEATVDMPRYSDVFRVPPGFNAPQHGAATWVNCVSSFIGMYSVSYAAPGYVQTDHLLLKRDLYGFVVVLSQIITRRGDARTNERSKPHTEPMMAPQ
ncbi:hypothetical protein Bca52824_047173 [Brassica carinata]|uniref:Uncharacterized protein n=1 Tax=Brassica carinata TaxID=52824 RepID=A0A8X7REB4_BRACI|nr:hypothetical protein Bca52824_047173 [Brassica carinata]